MSRLFGDSHRQLQRRFDTERLADRIESLLVRDRLTDENRSFIEAADMFFLATADAAGRPNCSYKGGDPGFVRVLDPGTLVFPSYDGNGMYLSTGNAVENPNVGLLFIDFANRKRLRVNGTAQLQAADAVQPPYAEAQCHRSSNNPQLWSSNIPHPSQQRPRRQRSDGWTYRSMLRGS